MLSVLLYGGPAELGIWLYDSAVRFGKMKASSMERNVEDACSSRKGRP
jgi:hypothetical protein